MAKKKPNPKKKSKQDVQARKDMSKSGDDLDKLMEATAEDWEILEMTERTLVAPDNADEETFYLETADGEDNKKSPADKPIVEDDEAEDDVFEIDVDDITRAASKAAADGDRPSPPPDEVNDDDIQAQAEPETDEGDLDIVEPAEDDSGLEPTEPTVTPDEETDEEKKAGLKKSHIIIIFLLLPLLGLLVGGGLFFFQKTVNAPGKTVAVNNRPVVAVSIPEPPPVAPRSSPKEAPPQAVAKPKTAPPRAQAPAPVVRKQPAAIPAAAAGKTTLSLRDVQFQKSGGGIQMKMLVGGPIKDYKSFSLSDPPRQVIDLFGDWNEPPFADKTVNAGGISRIRLGEHADKLRIVVDFSRNPSADPVFTSSADGLIMTMPSR